MGDVHITQHADRIVRVHVTDEPGMHFQGIIGFSPVLESQVDRPRAEIAAADADLNDCREFLALLICDLSGMHLLCKCSDLILLLLIKGPLVHAVGNDVIAELASRELMEDEALLTGIDDSTVIELRKLLCQLRLFCQGSQLSEQRIVNLFRCIIKGQSFRHGNTVRSHALSTLVARHDFRQADHVILVVYQILISFQCIEILP